MISYRIRNKQTIIKWRSNNVEKIKLSDRNRYKKDKEKIKQKVRRRKLMLKGVVGTHTKQEWNDLKFIYNYKCWICERVEPEIELTRDHIIPISKGGHDNIENIIPLCRSCNSSKGTLGVEWFKKKLMENQPTGEATTVEEAPTDGIS
jgi:5-methylcytosine-specific restriction endonuclease McrA